MQKTEEPETIRNILFDMGQVLIRFDRAYFIRKLGAEGGDAAILEREVFLSREWAMMDWGTLTDDEAAERICQRLPERLHDAARKLVSMWDRPILPVEGMEDLVRELKAAGYRLFLLSNASVRQHDYWPRIPGSDCFEDTLISADEKMVKPQLEIYLRACEKFGIRPEESLFIDDAPINIEGAAHVGMAGIVFHGDVKELRTGLSEYGIRIRTPEN